MPLGEVLYESGDKLCYAYFPTTCIVLLLYIMENGASTEVAVVGNEGMIGVAIFMNGGTMPNQAVIVSGGFAYRLQVQLLIKEFDRLAGNELLMTQELSANLLGVRREGITEAASRLQRAGYIDYHRAHITVLNRSGLEARIFCECYQVVKAESDRLLSPPWYAPLIS
jgi:CRP-like cAMP-binding protein